MKRLLRTVLLLALFGAMPAMSAPFPAEVDVQQAAALQKEGALLLDVREPKEFAAVHAVGATLIPLGELPSRLDELKQYKDKPITVICRSGRRSARGSEILRDAGFSQVANIEGGTSAWESAGLPVARN